MLRYPKEYDVNIRLANTYVWYDGNPAHSIGASGGGDSVPSCDIYMADLSKEKGIYKISYHVETVDPNSDKFDARPFKMGWMSSYFGMGWMSSYCGCGAAYVMRQPQRSQRAGMSANNCCVFTPDNSASVGQALHHYTTVFASMLDIYDENLDAAYLKIKNGYAGVALSKDFAVFATKHKGGTFLILYYKYFPVGVINMEEKHFYEQKGLDAKIVNRVSEFLVKEKVERK